MKCAIFKKKLYNACVIQDFLLYVNDIANAVPDQHIKLFTDDTYLFIASKNPDHLNTIANDAIDDLNIWFIANRLSLHLDKTCYMVFLPNRGGSCANFCIQLNGIQIKK